MKLARTRSCARAGATEIPTAVCEKRRGPVILPTLMKPTHAPLAIALSVLSLVGCSAAAGEGDYGSVDQAVLGKDTFLYFRCNATGWQPTPVTRLVASTTEPGVFTLNYTVTQSWMVSNWDQCTFTETNRMDAWGTWQD